MTADVTRADDCRGFVDQAARAFGGIDILLNNAGTSAAHGLEEVDDAAWQADIDLKLMAAVRLCRAVIPTHAGARRRRHRQHDDRRR